MRHTLANAEIVVSAYATDAVPQGQGNAASASGKHDLTSKILPGLEFSNVLFAGEQTYVIWKPKLHISRPRVRLQRPAVYFTVTISLKSSALNEPRADRRDILESFEVLSANVLEPLQFDPSFSGAGASLPEDRISKVLPTSATSREEVKPIRGSTKRAFPVVPPLYTRTRYSTLHDAVIASLHLEPSQLVSGTISVQEINLSLSDATIHRLTSTLNMTGLVAGDELVSLYKIAPKRESRTLSTSTVAMSIKATVHIDQGSSVELEVSWQTSVDLTKIAAKPMYKWSRPLSGGPLQPSPRPSIQAGHWPSTSGLSQDSAKHETGMIFSFMAHSTVQKGAEFSLRIHCANRNSRTHRFALVVLHPKRQNTTTQQRESSLEKADLIASIFNAPLLERTKPSDILDLNADVRIGPLAPRAIYETQLKFRALNTGPLDLGVIRIVDLDTRQTVDVRDLPDVVAV